MQADLPPGAKRSVRRARVRRHPGDGDEREAARARQREPRRVPRRLAHWERDVTRAGAGRLGRRFSTPRSSRRTWRRSADALTGQPGARKGLKGGHSGTRSGLGHAGRFQIACHSRARNQLNPRWPRQDSNLRTLAITGENTGADGRIRTGDLLITNQLLYQLSYVGDGRSCRPGGRGAGAFIARFSGRVAPHQTPSAVARLTPPGHPHRMARNARWRPPMTVLPLVDLLILMGTGSRRDRLRAQGGGAHHHLQPHASWGSRRSTCC